MKKKLSFICLVVGICIISITGNGCKSRNQNQANDSIVTESASDELTQFRKKFTIENILSLFDNPKNKSFAQKCGLEFILEDKDEYGGYQIIYGYDVEKGEKTDNWYDINALSEHSTYFKYECCESVGWMAYFKSKEDADYFINEAKRHGFTRKDDCYTNGKWGMSMTEDEDWCCCQIYEYVEYEEYEEATDNSNPNNGMSESNKQKALQYMSDLEHIRMQIDDILNQYNRLSSRNSVNPLSFDNFKLDAFQEIDKLSNQAGKIFDNLISLARETGGDVSALQQQKKAFLSDAYRIQHAIYNGE